MSEIRKMCSCKLCRWNREIDRIGKKLSDHDFNRLSMILDVMWNENEELQMELAHKRAKP